MGMGRDLFDQSPLARRYFETANQVLGFSLSQLCFEGPPDALTATEIAQPAILTVSVICFELFAGEFPAARFTPVAAAGHSLGEYSALTAAQALKFEDAVLLVHRRGKYMQQAVKAGQGKMVAILGKEAAEVQAALDQVSEGIVEIANINAPGQIVIAGQKQAVEEALGYLSGAKMVELPVSAPFHCALMQPAAEKLAGDLAAVSLQPAKFPVYSNFSAQAVSQPEQIRECLERQVCGRVRWVECMENAWIETRPDLALEFGCGAVLSGLMKRINPKAPRANADSLSSLESLRKLPG